MFLLILLSFTTAASPAQPSGQQPNSNNDPATAQQITELRNQHSAIAKSVTELDKKVVKLEQSLVPADTNEVKWYEMLLALLPLLCSLAALAIILHRLKGFNLINALSNDEPVKDKDGNFVILDPSRLDQGKYLFTRSTSRLVAFLSGVTAIVIAVSLSCYYSYAWLKHEKAPEFNSFFTMMLSLGIGVIPYTVNKISQGVTEGAAKAAAASSATTTNSPLIPIDTPTPASLGTGAAANTTSANTASTLIPDAVHHPSSQPVKPSSGIGAIADLSLTSAGASLIPEAVSGPNFSSAPIPATSLAPNSTSVPIPDVSPVPGFQNIDIPRTPPVPGSLKVSIPDSSPTPS